MEKGDTVLYLGETTSVLDNNKEYKVFSASETGVQLYINTGFAGVSIEDVILVKIK